VPHSGESPRVRVKRIASVGPRWFELRTPSESGVSHNYMKIAIFSYRRARGGRLPRAEAGVVELL
jgi:hypothetical protein